MKKFCAPLFAALYLIAASHLAGYAAENPGARLAELRAIESRGDLYHLSLEKLRTLSGAGREDLLDLPEDEILWLLSYGLDMHDHMLFSLVGESGRGARLHDKKLRAFTDGYNAVWNGINSAYDALSNEKKTPSATDKLLDLLIKGASPLELIPIPSEGLKFTWEMIKGWLAQREKQEAFTAELKAVRARHAALLENAPDSPWNFALLSYARLRRQSAEYVKELNRIETEIARLSIPYLKTRYLNDGILSIKQELTVYDARIRRAVVDVPVFTIQFYAGSRIENAKGTFRDDKKAIMEAGALFARTAALINLAVDDNVRKGWSDIAGELKALLSREQYGELKTRSQAVNMMWDFDDFPRTINWP